MKLKDIVEIPLLDNAEIYALGELEVVVDVEKLSKILGDYFGFIELSNKHYKDEYAKLSEDVVNYSLTQGLATSISSNIKQWLRVKNVQ